jgi:hypothetical protein
VIVPIVEGQGDAKAVPVLLRRIFEHHGEYTLPIGKPIVRPRQQITKPEELEKWVGQAVQRAGCTAVLVLLDADEECGNRVTPLGPELRARAQAVTDLPVFVVLANKEFEAWLLAGIEGLREAGRVYEDAEAPLDVEAMSHPKGNLSGLMGPDGPYGETVDQASFAHLFDMGWALQRSRSFQKLWKDVDDLLSQLGSPTQPPPAPGL